MADASLELIIGAKDQTKSAFSSLQSSMKVAGVALAGYATAFGAFAVKSVTAFADLGEELSNLKASTGIGVGALSTLKLAAEETGVGMETIVGGIKLMQKNLGEMGVKGKEAQGGLRAVGLSFDEIKKLAPEQQMFTIGQAIAKLPTATERTSAALDLFGKAGTNLLPMFEQGAMSFDEWTSKAEEMGVAMDDLAVNQAGAMDEALDTMKTAFKGISQTLALTLIPVFKDLADWVVKNRGKIMDFIKAGLQKLGQILSWLATTIWPPLKKFLVATFDLFQKLFGGSSKLSEAIGGALSGALTIAIGVLTTLVTGLSRLVDFFSGSENAGLRFVLFLKESFATAIAFVLEKLSFLPDMFAQYFRDASENARVELQALDVQAASSTSLIGDFYHKMKDKVVTVYSAIAAKAQAVQELQIQLAQEQEAMKTKISDEQLKAMVEETQATYEKIASVVTTYLTETEGQIKDSQTRIDTLNQTMRDNQIDYEKTVFETKKKNRNELLKLEEDYQKSLKNITQTEAESAAGVIVDAEENTVKVSKELADLEHDYKKAKRGEASRDELRSMKEKIQAKKEELQELNALLETGNNFEINLTQELNRERALASMNELQRIAFLANEERTQAGEAYALKKAQAILEQQEASARLQAAFQEKQTLLQQELSEETTKLTTTQAAYDAYYQAIAKADTSFSAQFMMNRKTESKFAIENLQTLQSYYAKLQGNTAALSGSAFMGAGVNVSQATSDKQAKITRLTGIYQQMKAQGKDSLANTALQQIQALKAELKQLEAGAQAAAYAPSMATGGIVPGHPGESMLIRAHAGETVTPAKQSAGITVNLQGANFYGDDKTFARKIGEEIANKLKLRTQFAR